ncbi:hypothetical protein ACFLSE_07965 [Bacteroidota bacterium]
MDNLFKEYYETTAKVLNPHGGRSAKLCLNPFYYDQEFWDKLDRITRAYANLLEFVFQNFPVDKRIQNVLDYPDELEKYLRSLNIYSNNMAAARIDIFLTKDGLRMVESNCEIPGGSEESFFLETEYMNIIQPKNVEQIPRLEIVYNTLMHHYKIQAQAKGFPLKDKLNIYLINWQEEIDRIQGEYAILINYIKAKGHNCGVIDPNNLIIEDKKVKTPDGEVVDLIYRRFTADELPKYAKKSWQMAIDLNNADVAIANPFCTKRVDSKNIMVLFKDERYDDVFPENLKADLEIVREIIPWTKKIEEKINVDGKEVDAKEYLLNNRERLVIKHANAYSSMAVFIGVDCEELKWREIVEESIKGDWIVQEIIDLPEIEIEYWEDNKIKKATCIYNVNPYMYDGKLGGFYIRASTDRLTSFKVGETATVIPSFKKN